MEYQRTPDQDVPKAVESVKYPTLQGENSAQLQRMQPAADEVSPLLTEEKKATPPSRPKRELPGGDAPVRRDVVLPEPATHPDLPEPLTKEAEKARETLGASPQLQMGKVDPARVATACPVPEGMMGVFHLAAGDQMDVTSTGFITCVGLVLERKLRDGGKRVGFSHVNGADLEGSGIDEIVEALGYEDIEAYLAYVGEIGNGDETMLAVLTYLVEKGIGIEGVSVIPEHPTENGNLMATLRGSAAPEFADTEDEALAKEMAAREDAMVAEHPDLGLHRAKAAYGKELNQGVSSGAIPMDTVTAEFARIGQNEALKRYPTPFHPSKAAEGYRGNSWSPAKKTAPEEFRRRPDGDGGIK